MTSSQEIKLHSYKPVEIRLPNYNPSKSDIDKEVKKLAEMHVSYEAIAPRAIGPIDTVLVKMTTFEESGGSRKPFPGFNTPGEGRVIRLGRGTMPTQFEEQVVKLTVGVPARIEFDVPDMPDGPRGETTTVHATSDITVLEIRREILPNVTDEWVAANYPGDKTVDKLRERLAGQIKAKRLRTLISAAPNWAAGLLPERIHGEIPTEVLDEGFHRYNADFDRFLDERGLNRTEYLQREGITADAFDEQMRQETAEMVAVDVALDAYARHFEIEPTEVDIDAIFGKDDPQSTASARAAAERAGQLDQIRAKARRRRAMEHLCRASKFLSSDGVEDKAFEQSLYEVMDNQHREDEIHASAQSREADAAKQEG